MCLNCLLEDRSGQNEKRFPRRDGLSVYSVKLPMKGEPSVYRRRRSSVISARLSIGVSGFLNCCRNVVGRRNPRRNYLGTTVKTIPELAAVVGNNLTIRYNWLSCGRLYSVHITYTNKNEGIREVS
ncbi:hypothetical protein RUM43_009283 [Polyplax serrata]|uniref:Uncharacterized protein n=1 Tax=Polyplax serrata TaxID=468196 RepID=A0AAN8S122_POLSC